MDWQWRERTLHIAGDELQELIDCYLDTVAVDGRASSVRFILPRDPEVDEALRRFELDGWEAGQELTRQLKRHLLAAGRDQFAIEDDLATEWSRKVASEVHRVEDRAMRVRRYAKVVAAADELVVELDIGPDTNVGMAPPDAPPIAAQSLQR